jgi:hypothetical protein
MRLYEVTLIYDPSLEDKGHRGQVVRICPGVITQGLPS